MMNKFEAVSSRRDDTAAIQSPKDEEKTAADLADEMQLNDLQVRSRLKISMKKMWKWLLTFTQLLCSMSSRLRLKRRARQVCIPEEP